jgi:raffinose/stachyose/melibiose transport system permease protein
MKKTLLYFLYLFIFLIYFLPMSNVLINSLKSKGNAINMSFSLKDVTVHDFINNYTSVIKETKIFNALFNTLVLTVLSVLLLVLFSSAIGYIINRRKDKITGFLNITLIIGMTLPLSIVPLYFMMQKVHISGTFLGTSFVYIGWLISMSVFLYAGALKSIPKSIDESAIIDGCGPIRTFYRIIFPLLIPVTVTVVIIDALAVWNDFMVVLYLFNSPSKFTLSLSIFSFFGAKLVEWNLLFADVVLISIPVIIFYLFLQKYIISGMTAGALKE